MSEAHQREAAIFDAAMELPPEQRAAYLDQACGGDAALLQRIESLLKASESKCEFLDSPTDPASRPTLQVPVPLSEKPGDRIGRYKLLEQIGEGGCGVVYVAEQTEPVRRRVALKIIKLGMDTRSVIARFEAERQALALMDHPNIAKVLDAGATETGRPYFVMELVRGLRITDYCDEKRLSTNARLDLFVQVCHAIQHAHQKGIIHRDIKPSNILVTVNDGVAIPKVIDFGVAKATGGQLLTDKTVYTAFEQFIGTPAYMSPEQAVLTSLDIDTRSDIYALGVLLYELLTGKTPFDVTELLAIGLDEMRRTIREKEPDRPSTRVSTLPGQELSTTAHRRGLEAPKLVSELRGDLDWIVMKCLEKDRARRYGTANALGEDVQRHLHNEPVVACPPSKLYRIQKTVRRNKLAFAAASAVAASLVLGLTLSTVLFFRERAARERADQQAAIARAINEFLQRDLLLQAESLYQAEAGFTPDPDLKVREALERAVVRIKDRFTNQPLQEAAVRMTIGRALEGVGEYGPAEEQLRRALELRQEKLGPDHTKTLSSMSELGWFYTVTFKSDQAVQLLEDTVKLSEARLGPDHPVTLGAMHRLAIACDRAGKPDQAVPLYEETLKRVKAKGWTDNSPPLGLMQDLAAGYYDAGKLDQAVPLYEETLSLMKTNLPPGHPYTLIAMANLARAYHTTGKLKQALPLFEETLELLKTTRGPAHPKTLQTMDMLANAYASAGKLDQALSLHEETLELMKTNLPPGHPYTLYAMCNLAACYLGAGKPDQALPLFEAALKGMMITPGPDHPETLGVMNDLAVAYASDNRLDQALPLFEETLRRRSTTLGPDHPDTLRSLNYLAEAYREAGKLTEAEALLRDHEALLRDRLTEVRQRNPGDPSKLVGPVNALVEVLLGQKKCAEAEQLLDEVLKGPVQDLPEAVELLRSRGRVRARRLLFAEAAADFSRVRDVNPNDHWVWNQVAVLLAASGQSDLYREHCRNSAEQFGNATDPDIAERIAKGWLLLPDSGADPARVAQMVDTAVAATNHRNAPWFQLVKGLAEYRKGRFASAVAWANQTLTKAGRIAERDVQAYMVLAMAQYRLKQIDEANAAFAKGAAIKRTVLPTLDSGDIGDRWLDWIMAYVLVREATALIEETLQDQKARLGLDDPKTLDTMSTLAKAYRETGKLAEVEALFRDRLTDIRQRNPGDPSKLTGPVNDLVRVLLGQNKYAEAEEVFDEVLTGSVQDQPEAVELLRSRGHLRARRGEFAEAAADLVRVQQVHPEDHVGWHEVAALLVASGKPGAYREHCRQSAERFCKSDKPVIAERIAKDCLILSDSGADLDVVAQMADTAAAATNHWATPWFQLVKGLAEYRQGHFASAVEWLNKTLTKTGAPARDAEAYVVLAMAHYQLKQTDEARAALAKGAEIERTKLPKLESGDIGDGWLDWIIAHAFMHEAKALIEGSSTTTAASQ